MLLHSYLTLWDVISVDYIRVGPPGMKVTKSTKPKVFVSDGSTPLRGVCLVFTKMPTGNPITEQNISKVWLVQYLERLSWGHVGSCCVMSCHVIRIDQSFINYTKWHVIICCVTREHGSPVVQVFTWWVVGLRSIAISDLMGFLSINKGILSELLGKQIYY